MSTNSQQKPQNLILSPGVKKTVIMFVLNSGSRVQLDKMKLNSHRSLQCCSIHSGVISITFMKPEMKLRQMNTLKSHEETFTRILTSRGN